MINQHCYGHESLIFFWLAKKRSLLSKYFLVFLYGMVHGRAKLKRKKEKETYFSCKDCGICVL